MGMVVDGKGHLLAPTMHLRLFMGPNNNNPAKMDWHKDKKNKKKPKFDDFRPKQKFDEDEEDPQKLIQDGLDDYFGHVDEEEFDFEYIDDDDDLDEDE